jgi:hypothetical protein
MIINIEERKPIGIWCFKSVSTSDCSFFDNQGIIWGETIPSTGPLLLTVIDGQERSTVPEVLASSVKEIYELLPKAGVSIETIQVRGGLHEDVRVNTNAGPYLLMTTVFPLASQVENLKVILDREGNNPNLEYIDLRIEGRAYYK